MPAPSAPIGGFEPETDLEREIVADPQVVAGLAWGKPRRGHPEGSVGAHVADLLEAIDRAGESGERRRLLRLIALVHDAFKYRVHEWLPKSGGNHHATRARRFVERMVSDERVLATVELHDRPYNIWRKMQLTGRLDEAAFEDMMSRIPDRQLFMRFIELDGGTEGKNPDPIRWFRDELRRRGMLD